MTASYDDLSIERRRECWGWFGQPWPSGICYDDDDRLLEEMRKPFPAGEVCLHCEEPFDEARGDRGQAMPFVGEGGRMSIIHVHIECSMRQVVGPLAHLEKRCRCYGGTDHASPGMTEREEAIEVWNRWTKRPI
jgi:hypothetical protein